MPKILLIEDEGVISEPISIVLTMHGYEVAMARNGKEAYKLCQKTNFDLILLDIMMPVWDGIEFLKRAELGKASPKTKIIIMSNLALGAEINQALALGAHKNILKANITPKILLELVRTEIG